MPQIDRQILNEIVSLLIPHCPDIAARQSLLNSALFGCKVLNQIDLSGAPQDFAVQLVRKLSDFGDCEPGQPALVMLLEELKKQVGFDKQANTERVIRNILGRHDAIFANLYTIPESVRERASPNLVGRSALLDSLNTDLKNNTARILLQAFPGVGKTALAAEVAYNWLSEQRGKVLWLRLGRASADEALDALAYPFGAFQIMASYPNFSKYEVMQQLIRANDVSLVILDDAWKESTLQELQNAIPSNVPLLVTSRQQLFLTQVVNVSDLLEDDALALLKSLAPKQTQDEEMSRKVCQMLANFAFSIQIAGKTMNTKNYLAKEYLQRLSSFFPRRHADVAPLIQMTLDILPNDAKAVFAAWGAFWSTQITAEMMALYFNLPKGCFGQIHSFVKSDYHKKLQLNEIIEALDNLHQYGLARREPESTQDGRIVSVAYYKLHDLAHAFAMANHTNRTRSYALNSCLQFVNRYSKYSPESVAALTPEIGNCLGAVEFALQQKRYQDVLTFTNILEPGILNVRGYYRQAIALLHDKTIKAAQELGDETLISKYQSNLGTNLATIGEYDNALDYYQKALAISQNSEDTVGEVFDLGNIGHVYLLQQRYDEAIKYLKDILVIVQNPIEANALNNLGVAYENKMELETAKVHYQSALEIAEKNEELNVLKGEILGNLGNIERKEGKYQQAHEHLQQALDIFRDVDYTLKIGEALGNRGLVFLAEANYQEALQHVEEAEKIANEIGDIRNLAEWLDALGRVCEGQGDTVKARTYYEESIKNYETLHLNTEAQAVQARLDSLPK
jgi:tetratricopeptide (TPR) repeat protein